MSDALQTPSSPVRHRRHGAPDDADDLELSAEELAAAEQDADEQPRGRHGNASGGLSASDLIARLRSDPATRGATALTPVLHAVEAILEPEPFEPAKAADSAQPTAQAKAAPKAGRNLPAAIAVGASLAAVILVALFAYRPSFVAIVVLAAAIGIYELVLAIATVEARAPIIPLLVGGVAMDVAAWHRGQDGLVGALLLTVIGVAVWRLADGAAGYRQDVTAGVLVSLYVPFLAGFAILLVHPHDGVARVVLFIAAVVCSDTGGYIAGVFFGKHPMAPMVSPKKSWEGFAGSVLACCTLGSLIMAFTFHEQWWKGALFGAAIAVVATLGDLGESMIKRDLSLKDMGKLLPGHGGMMDRLDSLLPCAPVAYLLLQLFL